MTYRYLLSVMVGLISVAGLLLGYYLSMLPGTSQVMVRTPTEYEYVSIAGPIQPIPKLKSIDPLWRNLGRALFNSPLLSTDNTVACASCHVVSQGGDDGFPVSAGINGSIGSRNSPTVLNSAFNFRQFWDGRSADLAEQVLGPIHNPIEMGSNFSQIILKLKQSPEFVQAFRQVSPAGITQEAIIKALVTFEESLITPNAPIDRFLMGDKFALSAQQKIGYRKFVDFGCVSCHQGRNIGGNLYQRLGRIAGVPEKLLKDKGRFKITKNPNDQYVFKVPSLRNINRTAPYFHNGSVATLSEAVTIMAKGQLGIDLTKSDIEDLLALFEAFNGHLPKGQL